MIMRKKRMQKIPMLQLRKQIKTYRDQLAEAGKEYLSFFTVEVLDVQEKK